MQKQNSVIKNYILSTKAFILNDTVYSNCYDNANYNPFFEREKRMAIKPPSLNINKLFTTES